MSTTLSEKIYVRCVPELKYVWEAHGAGFGSQREQAAALLRAYDDNPSACRTITFEAQPHEDKSERIRIHCSERLKRRWDDHAAGFESRQDQLYALLRAYADATKKSRSVNFDL
jgi:hypothetical protein